MENNLQRNKQSNRLSLFMRWLAGAMLGYMISFILFVLNEILYVPIIGWVVSSEVEVLESIFFHALYDKLLSTNLTDNLAVFVYASLWAFIGALLMSGRRKQTRLGVIFLVLYVLAGCLSYVILIVRSVPT